MTRENKTQLRMALENDIEEHQEDRDNLVEEGRKLYHGLSILGEEIEGELKDYFY